MKSQKNVIVLSCGLLVFLALSFGPMLVTAWWHLIHGNQIKYAGKSFQVSLRWYGKIQEDKAYITKLPLTVYSKRPTTGLVSFWPVETPPKTEAEKDLAYQSFSSVYWTYLAGGAGKTTGPLRRGIGENESVCMETSFVKDKWISVSCLLFRGTWYGTFYGEPKELGSFYRIIDNSQ